jgi:hypothetical protein
MRGQSVALLGVEYGVTLHVGDFPLGLLALGVGLGAGDAVGIDHEFAGLALADMPAEFERLLEGQPQRAGVALVTAADHSITTLMPLYGIPL